MFIEIVALLTRYEDVHFYANIEAQREREREKEKELLKVHEQTLYRFVNLNSTDNQLPNDNCPSWLIFQNSLSFVF